MLRLNDYNIRSNPAAGMHDPFLFRDPVTGKYYSYCTDAYPPPCGQDERIGIPVRSSADLLHFTYEGTALSAAAVLQGQDNGIYPPTQSFWAPCVEYAAGEYRMYYSATRDFGSPESRIWLAVSDNPLGPFENRGVAVDTWGMDGKTSPNAIDPHIIRENGNCWLVYGSFFGGIYLKALDPESGLPPDGDCRSLGTRISRKGAWDGLDGPEGASVVYVPEEGYFYLFQSYGWLGDTYDIRVGRSRTVTGVYTDRNGNSLDGQSPGEKLAGSYCFRAENPSIGNDCADWTWGGFRAPGHGIPFFDPVRKAWFFAHHVRDGAEINRFRELSDGRISYRRHYGVLRPMFFVNGWPVFSPEPFTGESLVPVKVTAEAEWELLFFDNAFQGLQHSVMRRLSPDNPLFRQGIVYHCVDYENGKPALALTGADKFGVAYWGKLLYNGDITDLCKIPEERPYAAYQKSG